MPIKEFLFHYLSLEHLIYILKNSEFSFCNPDFWNDKNDAFFCQKAVSPNRIAGIICFTRERETCTHWSTFANNGIGIKISFCRENLISSLEESVKKSPELTNKHAELIHSNILYKGRKKLAETDLSKINKKYPLLFIKKSSYNNESEYRIACIVDSSKEIANNKVVCRVPFSLKCITRITISPYIKKTVAHDIIKLLKAFIESLPNGKELDIEFKRSTMMYDRKWRNIGRDLKKKLADIPIETEKGV